MTNQERRYAKLVDGAYTAVETDSAYIDILERTREFLFREDDRLFEDLPDDDSRDIALEMHLPRLRDLFAAQASHARSAGHNYAKLKINLSDQTIECNEAAKKIFGPDYPGSIRDLALSSETMTSLRHHLFEDSEQQNRRAILLKPIDDTNRTYLAFISFLGSDQAEMSISSVDWNERLISLISEAFGLTFREKEVFSHFLAGRSQEQVAQALDRSVETVRSQAKSTLRKTGCTKMSEVVQIAAGLAYISTDEPQAAKLEVSSLEWQTSTQGMQTIDRPGGRKVAVYTRGEGNTRVLFLHGFLQGPFFTQAFIDALTANDLCLICPSRPGFGYTSASSSRASYEDTVLDDCIAVLDHLDLGSTMLVSHQLSSNHAFRLLRKHPNRIDAMLMVSAGPPIVDEYWRHMDRPTRIGAAAARHAPSVLKMINEIGIQTHRRKGGPLGFLRSRYRDSKLDLSTLNEPELANAQTQGVYHYIEQGAETMVREAASAMKDWSPLLSVKGSPVTWIHGAQCSALDASVVREIVESRSNAVFDIIPDAGTMLIHQKPNLVASAIRGLCVS
ncbi:MAG: alpha/beta fold hydrolase [Pseudomonadota bacterium]